MKKILGILVLLSLAACSSDEAAVDVIPGSELPELTAEQQGRMGQFSQGMEDAQGATSDYNQRPDNNLGTVSLFRQAAQVVGRELSQKGAEVAKKVGDAIESDECALTAVWPDEDPASSTKDPNQPVIPFMLPNQGGVPNQSEGFAFEINVEIGNNKTTRCPIYSLFNFSLDGEMNQTGQQSASGKFNFSFLNKFNVKEWSTIYSELDIVGYSTDFNGSINFNANQNAFAINGTGSGTTNIFSKPSFEGLVSLKTTMGINGSGSNENNMQLNMQIVSDYSFTDFRAVGVIRGSMQGQQQEMNLRYYINGDEVTEQEYIEMFSGSLTQDTLADVGNEGSMGMNFLGQ